MAAGYLSKFQFPDLGGAIYFDVDGNAKPVSLGALIYDPTELPVISQLPMFYASPDMLAELGGAYEFTTVLFNLKQFDQAQAEEAVRLVESKLNKTRVQVNSITIIDPLVHPNHEIFDAFLVILGVMGACSLAFSAFLVVNTINALVAQQVNQIGAMKTVGATTGQIAMVYLSGVAAYGVLSLLLALPLGVLGSALLSNLILAPFNVSTGQFDIAWSAFGYQVAAGLLTPLAAGLWPVWQATRISIRQAIASYGLGAGRYGAGRLDRVLGRVGGLPPSLTLILRRRCFDIAQVPAAGQRLVCAHCGLPVDHDGLHCHRRRVQSVEHHFHQCIWSAAARSA